MLKKALPHPKRDEAALIFPEAYLSYDVQLPDSPYFLIVFHYAVYV